MTSLKKLLYPDISMIPCFDEPLSEIERSDPPTDEERRRARRLSKGIVAMWFLRGAGLRDAHWKYRLNGTKRLHFIHALLKSDEYLGQRPNCLALAPRRREVVQVVLAKNHKPLFLSESNPGKRWHRRIFERGHWEDEVLEIIGAVRAQVKAEGITP